MAALNTTDKSLSVCATSPEPPVGRFTPRALAPSFFFSRGVRRGDVGPPRLGGHPGALESSSVQDGGSNVSGEGKKSRVVGPEGLEPPTSTV
jgi:hypothetical protein